MWHSSAKILARSLRSFHNYHQARKRPGLRAGGGSGDEVRKKMDEQKILEEKLDAAKKDLEDWKCFSDTVGQIKEGDLR